MPSVNVVNGKQIVVENLGFGERAIRFFCRPFAQMWHHRDLIQAILRREVAERFKGSIAGWVWAVVAPLLAIAVFTFWSEMAFRAPMLLHEYVHFIKQTIFPSDMLAVISTLRATIYTVISVA